MATFKVCIGEQKGGKTHQKELSDDHAETLIGKKIGETVKGKDIGLDGYEFEITGGSDYCGFPMRKDVQGTNRKKVLITKGVGLRAGKRKGLRVRKNVAGNTVYEKTAQVNLKVTKAGKEPLTPPTEAPAEEKQE